MLGDSYLLIWTWLMCRRVGHRFRLLLLLQVELSMWREGHRYHLGGRLVRFNVELFILFGHFHH